MVAARQGKPDRIVPALIFGSLALLLCTDSAFAHDVSADAARAMAVSELSVWVKTRFSESELNALRVEDLGIESHYCGCYDRPKPHYPYPIVLFKTPKGDLVARPDSSEGAVSFTPLAVRHGEQYCELDSEQVCHGSFSSPCDFTDFRYGPTLSQFFPSCKSQEVEPDDIAARR